MQKFSFKRTALAHGVAVALGATVATPIMAQDGSEEVIEEIVTTGIRSSLMQSMDRKKSAKGVVDAITSEDFGKFPDQNLAESLQRITGVSIDRSNNEGSRITVRGMGPEFNLVTLNGRSMPTAGGRSFDFADIASEGVQAVEIYKTAKAGLPTGGIGATVNIQTMKPLQSPGFRSAVSAKAVHETSSSDSSIAGLDEWTPEITGLYSQTFADDTIGIGISASFSERNNREENASIANWTPNRIGALDDGNVNNNNQRADGTYWHPQNYGVGLAENQRERINSQLVLQYAPTDRITATLDYTYSEVEFDKDANSAGIWFECPNIDATVNANGTVTEVTQSCNDYATNVSRDHTIKENNSIGLNVDWQVNDSLNLNFDLHDSSSQFGGAGILDEPGSSWNFIIGNAHDGDWGDFVGAGGVPPYPEPLTSPADIDEQTLRVTSGALPTYDVSFVGQGFDAGVPQENLVANDIGSLFGQAFNTDTYNDVLQFQLKGSWENMDAGSIRQINFGFSHAEQEFDTRSADSGLLGAGFWLVSNAWWPDEVFEQRSIAGALGGFSNGGDFGLNTYWAVPFETGIDIYETIGVGDFANFAYWGSDLQGGFGGWCDTTFTSTLGPNLENCTSDNGTRGRFWSGPLGNGGSNLVDEKIQSAYTEFVIEDEFNDMPLNVVLGLRYETTEVKSYGLELTPEAIIWSGGNEFAYDFSDQQISRVGNNKYDFWLPSFDLDIEVYPDIITRFSYSRSIARPPIGALNPSRAFIGDPNVRSRDASSGNPGLLPYVSDNFDLSFEWYYGEGSYASVGHFRKRVENFLVSETELVFFDDLGLTDPFVGVLAEQARIELQDEGTVADAEAVFLRINENRGAPLGTPVRGGPQDPLAEFRLSRVENQEVGDLFGWEFAVQHMFADTGFGVQANLTIVNGDVDADRDSVNQSFALPGLSDSGNLQVFFENELIAARLSWNWRDEFLGGFDQFGAPVYTEEFTPLDMNFTWYATDNLSVFVEGLNLTNEVQRVYSRYPEQFLVGNEYGSRFNIGALYNF